VSDLDESPPVAVCTDRDSLVVFAELVQERLFRVFFEAVRQGRVDPFRRLRLDREVTKAAVLVAVGNVYQLRVFLVFSNFETKIELRIFDGVRSSEGAGHGYFRSRASSIARRMAFLKSGSMPVSRVTRAYSDLPV
jgi:hypothetical protein